MKIDFFYEGVRGVIATVPAKESSLWNFTLGELIDLIIIVREDRNPTDAAASISATNYAYLSSHF